MTAAKDLTWQVTFSVGERVTQSARITMNYMRKILGSSSGSFTSTSVDEPTAASPGPGGMATEAPPRGGGGQEAAASPDSGEQLLGLTHLNKLFSEFQKRRSGRGGTSGLHDESEESQLYAVSSRAGFFLFFVHISGGWLWKNPPVAWVIFWKLAWVISKPWVFRENLE